MGHSRHGEDGCCGQAPRTHALAWCCQSMFGKRRPLPHGGATVAKKRRKHVRGFSFLVSANLWKYVDQGISSPVDSDELIALVAPRPVLYYQCGRRSVGGPAWDVYGGGRGGPGSINCFMRKAPARTRCRHSSAHHTYRPLHIRRGKNAVDGIRFGTSSWLR